MVSSLLIRYLCTTEQSVVGEHASTKEAKADIAGRIGRMTGLGHEETFSGWVTRRTRVLLTSPDAGESHSPFSPLMRMIKSCDFSTANGRL